MARYQSIRRQIEGVLPTAAEILSEKRQNQALTILTTAEIEFFEAENKDPFDDDRNWIALLRIPVKSYVAIEDHSDKLSQTIGAAINTIIGSRSGFYVSIEIGPIQIEKDSNPSGQLSQKTRQAIIDELVAKETIWYGSMDEIEFLQRIFKLEEFPSQDDRYDNAEQDIYQHRISNDDWPTNWIYTDSRFNLLNTSQDTFIKFVCAIIHPVARREVVEQSQLVTAFNRHLSADGWELIEDIMIDERPVFIPEKTVRGINRPLQRIQASAISLQADELYKEIERLHLLGDSDPEVTIGIAKNLVESCAKFILDDRGIKFSEKGNFPKLLTQLRNEIKIMPKGVSETAKASEDVREIFTSLGKIATSLGLIRNEYGNGHGKRRGFRGLEARHARLAVGAASTFVEFALDRHSSLPIKAK